MKYCNTARRENSEKKLKKIGRGRMFTAALAQRGWGYTCNALQRSFDSLYTDLIRAIQGKDRCRRYIVKMKAKGLNIALIRLLIVCYLTCNIFMFIYKIIIQILVYVIKTQYISSVKRKEYHIVLTQDIRLLFTRVNVKRSVYVISKSVLLSVGIKREP